MKVFSIDEEVWLKFLEGCDSATFFHTPYWYKVWKAYSGYEYEARIYEFDNGKQVLFPLAWWKIKRGLLKRMVSSPAGTYGGWVASKTVSDEEASAILNDLKKEFSQIDIRRNWLAGEQPVVKSVDEVEDFTQVVSFHNKADFKSVLKEWTKGHLSAAKKGLKGPLQVFSVSDKESMEEYYLAYLESIERWGERASSKYGRELFEHIIDVVPHKYYQLWVAKLNANLAYGCLCFYFNKHVVYWHGAGKIEYFYLKPAQLLQYWIIKAAMGSGYWWYDFNPSGGHEGVVRFKQGFGVESHPAHFISLEKKHLLFLNCLHQWIKR